MVRWLDGITDSIDEFEQVDQVPGVGDGQGSKESDTTE